LTSSDPELKEIIKEINRIETIISGLFDELDLYNKELKSLKNKKLFLELMP